ncbi:NAD-dependent epimerase/dehydratase family protein [Exiguobacterium sp.]|uniref:polysaccharide biosynthesis C-terminal domain-containing protein n=1 Tax=Exiguobacterium sp. TaxID=44751 RepID=UPI00263BE150|nr:NAD-dependent epimerase/dehydratase family protein [Exiguobacterium sp.]MCC5891821.1 NAD-dependent epimerase/dehydratase family protein [Exiguobacterium sp.]
MNILITGANGFVGKNLVATLQGTNHELLCCTRDTPTDVLAAYCEQTDFVYHLAGINRTEQEAEFVEGNVTFTKQLVDMLTKAENLSPIMFASSIQATQDNPYGNSKRMAEELLMREQMTTGRRIYLYRFPNLFGKWGRPGYNSVVATFCDRVARNLPLDIHEPDRLMELAYIDDVLASLVALLDTPGELDAPFQEVSTHPPVSLGRIAELLLSFRESRKTLAVPQLEDSFTKRLYSTYLSYLPVDHFAYDLTMHEDKRGSFTEFIRTPDRGQVSINVAKPGITKGNHWHHTKNEKFLVVSGEAIIRFRKVGTDEVISYYVTGDMMRVVDIPVGYTHHIENVGTTDLVTVMWVNEAFDAANPDTIFMEVQNETSESDDHRRDTARNHQIIGRHPQT